METEDETKKVDETQKSQRFIEVITYLLFALGPLTGNVILVLFGVLSSEFSVSPNEILITIPSFMFPFAVTQLFSGAISDIKGRFKVILFGLIVFGAGMIFASFSMSLLMFVIANVLGGVGFGFINPVLIALMSDFTSEQKLPKKMGYLGAVANLGIGLGPLLAGQFALINWRLIYILFIIITIICFIIMLKLKQPPQKKVKDSSLRAFLSHLAQESRRLVVILMVVSAYLASHTFIATIVWTSRAYTGVVNEALLGIVLAIAGLMGGFSGLLFGFIIKIKGVAVTIFIGLISLFAGLLVLIALGDITSSDVLFFVTIGLILVSVAGGILLPSILYFSQALSREGRGALAGLTTAGQFIGVALVPTTYEIFYLDGGINAVYSTIFIVSVFLTVFIGLLFRLAYRVVRFHDI